MSKKIWSPNWFAEVKDDSEDSDYLRIQGCCTGCGANIDTLPGYYYLEDCDECPNCRKSSNSEKWSDEVKRVTKNKLLKEDRRELIKDMNEFDI